MAASTPRFDPTSVTSVVFDIGGVFCYPQYRPVHAKLAELLPADGLEPPADPIVYRQAHHAGVLALATHTLAAEEDPDEHLVEFWTHYDAAYTTTIGVPEQHREEVAVAMRTRWDWVHDANVAAFHRLHATGVPLAIVSNNDGTAPDQMKEFGVCQVGDGPLPSVAAIVDSTLEGVAKPDPAIFTPALDALGHDPATVLYVGDTVHADVVGATNAGMQVVQLDPFDHHAHFDHARIADLDELVGVLAGS